MNRLINLPIELQTMIWKNVYDNTLKEFSTQGQCIHEHKYYSNNKKVYSYNLTCETCNKRYTQNFHVKQNDKEGLEYYDDMIHIYYKERLFIDQCSKCEDIE